MSPATGLATELGQALKGSGEPGTAELLEALLALLDGTEGAGKAIGLTPLKGLVYRLQLEPGPGPRSLILKRREPVLAQLNRLVADRWLPALGMGDHCARLLATAAEREGRWVWNVYEDLGDGHLDGCTDRQRIEAAVDLVAELHARAAGHPLLPEVRHHSQDLGLPFFIANVGDAVRGLEALPAAARQPPKELMALRDRLLERLCPLVAETPGRRRS